MRRILKESSGILAGLMLPNIGGRVPTRADLAPGRLVELVLLERTALGALLFLLLLLLLLRIAALCGLGLWRRLRRGQGEPPRFLILPSPAAAGRILGLGVLLPLVLFWLYTRHSGAAGREYSLNYLGSRFLLELFLLGATILYASVAMTARVVRERCEALRIPAPEAKLEQNRGLLVAALGFTWSGCLALRWNLGWWPVLLAAPAGFLLLAHGGAFMLMALACRRYRAFFDIMPRSLMPLFAALAIILGSLVHPHLVWEEAVHLRNDKLLVSTGVTRIEHEVTLKIRNGIRKAAAALAAEKRAR